MSIIDLLRRLLGIGRDHSSHPSQPQEPNRIVEYRDIDDPDSVATIYYTIKNAVYGDKPAKITFHVAPRLFFVKHIRIAVECCGNTIVDEEEDLDAPITIPITIPFPGFDDGYTVRDTKITVEYTPGKGIEYQEGCEWHGGVCIPRIVVPRWTGPETVTRRYVETVTWYRDISAVKPIIEVKAPKTPLRYPETAEIEIRLRDPPFTSQYRFYIKFEGDGIEEECRCGGKVTVQGGVRIRTYRVEDTIFMDATPLIPGEHTIVFRACVATLKAEDDRLVEAERKCSDVYRVKITWIAPQQPQPPAEPEKPSHRVTVHVHGGAGGYVFVDGKPLGTYGFLAGGTCSTPGVVEVEEGEHVIQACERCRGVLAGAETNIASCSFPYRVNVTGDVELDVYNIGCVMDGGKPYIGVVYLYSKHKKRYSYRVDDEPSYRFSLPDGTAIIPLPAGKHTIHLKSHDIEVDVKGGSYRVVEV